MRASLGSWPGRDFVSRFSGGSYGTYQPHASLALSRRSPGELSSSAAGRLGGWVAGWLRTQGFLGLWDLPWAVSWVTFGWCFKGHPGGDVKFSKAMRTTTV